MDFKFVKQWLKSMGIENNLQELSLVIGVTIILVASYITYVIAHWVFDHAIERALRRAPERWYRALVDSGFFKRCANLAPVVIINSFIPVLFTNDFESWQSPLQTAVGIYLTWVITSILTSIANFVSIAYDYTPKTRDVPITGVIQVVKLVWY